MEFGIGLQKAGKKMNRNGVLGDDEKRGQRREIRRKNRGRWRNGRWYISSVLLYRHSQSEEKRTHVATAEEDEPRLLRQASYGGRSRHNTQ